MAFEVASVDPNSNLDVYPPGGSSSPFSVNTFFDIFVTIVSSNTITRYFSGAKQFSETSTGLNIATHYLNFFLHNTAAGGQGEWSSGNVALINVFNTALTQDQVEIETANPFLGTTGLLPDKPDSLPQRRRPRGLL